MKKITVLLLFLLILTLSACTDSIEKHHKDFYGVFDTRIAVTTWLESDKNANQLDDDIEELLDKIHKISTKYEAYEGINNVHYINNNPGTTITIDPILTDMIAMSIDIYNNDSSTFNIALGEVLNVWSDYREQCEEEEICEIPNILELFEASEKSNPNLIELDKDDNTVKIPEGMSLDLGAIAKGYAAELVGDYLRDQGVSTFMINAGDSNIEVEGNNPHKDRNYWIVGLKDPDNSISRYGRIKLTSGYSAVTSGDYERYYVVDGIEYHHLINPETLFPSRFTRTVTVVGKHPGLADVYSTIAFLLPIDQAIDFIDSLDDVEAIWFDIDREIHYSANFEDNYLIEILIDTD